MAEGNRGKERRGEEMGKEEGKRGNHYTILSRKMTPLALQEMNGEVADLDKLKRCLEVRIGRTWRLPNGGE